MVFLALSGVPAQTPGTTKVPAYASGTGEALLGLAAAAERVEKSIATSGLDRSTGAIQALRDLGLGYTTGVPLPTSAKTLSGKGKDKLFVLRGMYEADMAYAAAFNKRVDGILPLIALIDEASGYPGALIEKDIQEIEQNEGVSRSSASLRAMARASVTNPDLVYALTSSLYGQVIESFHILASLGLASGNATALLKAFGENGKSLALLEDLSRLYQDFILTRLGLGSTMSEEFARSIEDPVLKDRVVQDMLDTWDMFIVESEYGDPQTAMDLEGKSRVIVSLLEVTTKLKSPVTEADLRKILAITNDVRTATLSDAPPRAPAIPPLPAFTAVQSLAGKGFDTSMAELDSLFRFYCSIKYDPDAKIRVDWAWKLEKLQIREIAKTKVRYGYGVEKGGARQIIVIRGTDNFKNALVDAQTWKEKNPVLGIRLHDGFDRSATLLYKDVSQFLDRKIPVVVVGHSLGAAQAMIVGMYLQKDGYALEKIIAAGPPKVTDAEGWAVYRDLPVILIAGAYDPVPFLPPEILYPKAPFIHQKPVLMLLDGVYATAMPQAYYNNMKKASADAKMAGEKLNFADHLPLPYVLRLDGKAREQQFVSPESWLQYARPTIK
jgi:hypothetical protein